MIRVPAQFNGAFISRHFFPDFLKYNNLQGINSGKCYDWAYFAYRMFPNIQLWTTDYHAWVRYGRKYHDSETGKLGVINFMELGCNRRNSYPVPWERQAPIPMEVEEFKSFWNREGSGHRKHWDTLLEPQLKKVLGKRYRETTPIFQPPIPATIVP